MWWWSIECLPSTFEKLRRLREKLRRISRAPDGKQKFLAAHNNVVGRHDDKFQKHYAIFCDECCFFFFVFRFPSLPPSGGHARFRSRYFLFVLISRQLGRQGGLKMFIGKSPSAIISRETPHDFWVNNNGDSYGYFDTDFDFLAKHGGEGRLHERDSCIQRIARARARSDQIASGALGYVRRLLHIYNIFIGFISWKYHARARAHARRNRFVKIIYNSVTMGEHFSGVIVRATFYNESSIYIYSILSRYESRELYRSAV